MSKISFRETAADFAWAISFSREPELLEIDAQHRQLLLAAFARYPDPPGVELNHLID